jgi:hypothetical protein
VPLAERLTREHPLHEAAWRLLALALWGAGRQADALAALRRAKATIAEELGLDPGPELTALEQAILTQSVAVLYAATHPRPVHPQRTEPAPPPSPVDEELFVGRAAELEIIRRAAEAARTGGGVVLVGGEPGSGKSSLLRRAIRRLAAAGWTAVVGRCPESEGAPPAWAWTEALRSLAERVPPGDLATAVAPALAVEQVPTAFGGGTAASTSRQGAAVNDTATGRFHLHRAVCAWLATASGTAPTAVVLDDLHRADAETLALLTTAATELVGRPVLLIAAYCPDEAAAETFPETLATLARRSPNRIALAGLARPDVAGLVAAICGSDVDGDTIAALLDRTGGNPFYVTESARLLAGEGALVATSEVPEGVRDVLRRRFARLPEPVVAILRLAAVVGRESDVDLLVRAADADEPTVLDAIDAGLIAGLLTEPDPGRVRFVHALVRDTLYTDLSRARRTRAHARVAQELEQLRPGDLAALAHHFAEAASAATARRAVDYAVRAAEAARRRYATDAWVALLEQALANLPQAQAGEATRAGDDEHVELLGQLLRAQVRAGQVAGARQTRDRAVAVAESAGRPDLLLAAYAAWTEPTPWQIRPYGTVDDRVVTHLVQLLAGDDLTDAVRCGLISVLLAELEGTVDSRQDTLAEQAAALAARCGDPWLVGLALTAQVKVPAAANNPAAWLDVAQRLDDLCAAHELPPYLWFRDYLRARAAAISNDVAAFLRHVAAARETAQRYRIPEAFANMECAAATYAHIRGDFAAARRDYAQTSATMTRLGSMHSEDFYVYAQLTIALSEVQSGVGDLVGLGRDALLAADRFGPIAGDVAALVLTMQGDLDRARTLHAAALPPRPDYFWVAFAVLQAGVAVALGETDEAAEHYRALLPHADQIAGIGSISIALGPVAFVLGDIARLLGRTATARAHYEQAARVAQHWDARHWVDTALDRLGALAEPEVAAP